MLPRPTSSEPLNRMNPIYKFGVWLRVRNNSAESFEETAEGVFRAREVRRLEQQGRWDKEAINNVIGVPWRLVDGKWTVDRPTIQIDPLPPPPVPFEGVRVQRDNQDRHRSLRNHCRMPGLQCDPIWKSEPKPTLTPAASGLRNVSK